MEGECNILFVKNVEGGVCLFFFNKNGFIVKVHRCFPLFFLVRCESAQSVCVLCGDVVWNPTSVLTFIFFFFG